jgi:hypothetical protein
VRPTRDKRGMSEMGAGVVDGPATGWSLPWVPAGKGIGDGGRAGAGAEATTTMRDRERERERERGLKARLLGFFDSCRLGVCDDDDGGHERHPDDSERWWLTARINGGDSMVGCVEIAEEGDPDRVKKHPAGGKLLTILAEVVR